MIYGKTNSIEASVRGTKYNPSDSDMAEGRVCYSDVERDLGRNVAEQWSELKRMADSVYDMNKKQLENFLK